MSEQFWFLDNLQESKTEKKENSFTENNSVEGKPEAEKWHLDYLQGESRVPEQPNTQRQESLTWDDLAGDQKKTEEKTFDKEVEHVRAEFQKLNENHQSETKTELENMKTTENKPAWSQTGESSDVGKDSEIVIKVTTENNGKIVEDDKEYKYYYGSGIDSKLGEETNSAKTETDNFEQKEKSQTEEIGGVQQNQYCEELGSTVIDLNNYIAPDMAKLTGNEDISTAVNYITRDGKPQVELVVTIKDERKQDLPKVEDTPSTEELLPKKCSQCEETDLLKELMGDSAGVLDSVLKNLDKGRLYSSPRISTTSYNQSQRTNTDVYVREGDGARCYRTVVETPRGRTVQTNCYKAEHSTPYRRTQRNIRGYHRSLWEELDRALDLELNRMLFF